MLECRLSAFSRLSPADQVCVHKWAKMLMRGQHSQECYLQGLSMSVESGPVVTGVAGMLPIKGIAIYLTQLSRRKVLF